jgi:hypothetical protein
VMSGVRSRWLLAALFAATACGGSSQPAPPVPVADRAQAPAVAAPRRDGRDLRTDERLGGHTLQRHVGRSDADLVQRLRRERDISAASTYTDEATASVTVASAIGQSASKIEAWEARRGSRPNLVLRFVDTDGPPIGRSLQRGARTPEPCHRALVVLRWDERESRWYVLTSYPEADR